MMTNYIKQYFFNLKDRYEKYFLSVTDDKSAVVRAMDGFKFPDNPTLEDFDPLRKKFFDHLKRELPTLMNKSNVLDFQTKANQLRIKRNQRRL